MGLAWSTIGGSALYIETTCIHTNAVEDENEEKKQGLPRKSTLHKLHLGFIAKLIGREYASDEEVKAPAAQSDLEEFSFQKKKVD